MPRHQLYWTDPDLWEQVQEAARLDSVREKRTISASEWLAEAAKERLQKSRKAATV